MFTQATCAALPSAISSPESVSGRTLCETPGGQTTGKSGLEVAPVSPSARQVKAKDLQIPVTCGRFGWS